MSQLNFLQNSVELCSQSTKFIIFLFKAQLQAWSISHKYQEVPEATVRIKELIWTLDLSFKAVMYSEFGFMVKEMVIAEVCFLKLQNHFWNVFIETSVSAVHENEGTCSTAFVHSICVLMSLATPGCPISDPHSLSRGLSK